MSRTDINIIYAPLKRKRGYTDLTKQYVKIDIETPSGFDEKEIDQNTTTKEDTYDVTKTRRHRLHRKKQTTNLREGGEVMTSSGDRDAKTKDITSYSEHHHEGTHTACQKNSGEGFKINTKKI
uniref:uncharacterized protein LOC120340062 n=1 Tax=Styela clava TaxID=7725 RepID=UPI001939D0E6|nr:uncharacterized protein LOC120340062 [Styela clava]